MKIVLVICISLSFLLDLFDHSSFCDWRFFLKGIYLFDKLNSNRILIF